MSDAPQVKGVEPRIVCMCGRDIGFLVARFLLERAPGTRFVVNPGERSGGWHRSPLELPLQRMLLDEVPGYSPDLIVAAFFDRILPESIYSPPRLGCWNLHLGDPERYRGAYPNIRALRNGDSSYAVALHRVDGGIDTGPLLSKASFPIDPGFTGRDLYERMVEEGFELFRSCFADLLSGAALSMTRPQADAQAETFYRRELTHEIDVPDDLRNQVRALSFPPFPPPFIMIGGRRFVIVEDKSGSDAIMDEGVPDREG